MRSLELKIPPVMVTVIIGLVMCVTADLVPALAVPIPDPWRTVLVVVFVVSGGVIALLGVQAFRRAETTLNPLAPDSATALVSTGIYRLTRNPMYLGLLLALAGEAVWLGHLLAPLFVLGFALYMTRFQIRPEEEALARLHGEEFRRYRRSVRRWF